MKSIYLRKKMLVACRRPVVATLLVIVALFSSCTGLTESPYTLIIISRKKNWKVP